MLIQGQGIYGNVGDAPVAAGGVKDQGKIPNSPQIYQISTAFYY